MTVVAKDRADDGRLDGRVALVTGGDRGIGRAIAERLGRLGAAVAVGYRSNRGRADEVVAVLRRHDSRAWAAGADLTDPAAITSLLGAVAAELGPIDILISNAGIAPHGSLEDINVSEWDEVLQINLRAAFLLAQGTVPGMAERGWGRVIFLSSIAAFTGGIIGPHYAASKAGMLGLMHSLARSYAPRGITINAITPALIDTGMLTAENRESLARQVPVGRLGLPDEVAEIVIATLINPYITDQTIGVNGGLFPE